MARLFPRTPRTTRRGLTVHRGQVFPPTRAERRHLPVRPSHRLLQTHECISRRRRGGMEARLVALVFQLLQYMAEREPRHLRPSPVDSAKLLGELPPASRSRPAGCGGLERFQFPVVRSVRLPPSRATTKTSRFGGPRSHGGMVSRLPSPHKARILLMLTLTQRAIRRVSRNTSIG